MTDSESGTHHPHAYSKIPLVFLLGGAGITAIVVAMVALLKGADALTDAALAIVAGIVVFFYGYGINYRISQRRTMPEQQELKVASDGRWISKKNDQRLRFALSVNRDYPNDGDQQIQLELRLHWVYLLRWITIPLAITALAIVGLAEFSSPQSIGFTNEGFDLVKHHHSLGFSLRDYYIAALCLGLVLTVISFYIWSRNFFVLTDYQIIRLRVYPVWLPFMLSNVYPMLLDRVENAYIEDSIFGGLVGYGGVQVVTYFQPNEDKYFTLRFIPKHNQVQRKIMLAQVARRARMTPERPPTMPNQFFDPPQR